MALSFKVWPANTSASQPPLSVLERMPNCDPSIYVHHVAVLSSGSDHINRVYFHPLSACLFRSRFDCGAEGSSCLQAVPVEVFSSDQSPASLCGSSNRPAKQTGYVRHAFRSLSSFSVDQRECSPAGVSLLLFISPVADCNCFG